MLRIFLTRWPKSSTLESYLMTESCGRWSGMKTNGTIKSRSSLILGGVKRLPANVIC